MHKSPHPSIPPPQSPPFTDAGSNTGRYYGITEGGRAQLTEARETWNEFARALDALLEQTDAEVTA